MISSRKTAKDIDLPSRIIAVADVFQALTQSRPYRDGLKMVKLCQYAPWLKPVTRQSSV